MPVVTRSRARRASDVQPKSRDPGGRAKPVASEAKSKPQAGASSKTKTVVSVVASKTQGRAGKTKTVPSEVQAKPDGMGHPKTVNSEVASSSLAKPQDRAGKTKVNAYEVKATPQTLGSKTKALASEAKPKPQTLISKTKPIASEVIPKPQTVGSKTTAVAQEEVQAKPREPTARPATKPASKAKGNGSLLQANPDDPMTLKRERNNTRRLIKKCKRHGAWAERVQCVTNEMLKLKQKNNLEMDALLSKVIKSDEASMDAFMSSPIMQTTMQSIQKLKTKSKITRSKVKRPSFKCTPLRVSMLKRIGNKDTGARAAGSKPNGPQVPCRKRGRSSDTDCDTPKGPKITMPSVFNFIRKAIKPSNKKARKDTGAVVSKVRVVAVAEVEQDAEVAQDPEPAPTINEEPGHDLQVLGTTFILGGPPEPPAAAAEEEQTNEAQIPVAVVKPNLVAIREELPVPEEAPTDVAVVAPLPLVANVPAVVPKPASLEPIGYQILPVAVAEVDEEVEHRDEERMPPPPSRNRSTFNIRDSKSEKENRDTYDITLIGDYEEETLEHRNEKAVPEWAKDPAQVNYLIYRFSSKFMDEATDHRILPRGTLYRRFYAAPLCPPTRWGRSKWAKN